MEEDDDELLLLLLELLELEEEEEEEEEEDCAEEVDGCALLSFSEVRFDSFPDDESEFEFESPGFSFSVLGKIQ